MLPTQVNIMKNWTNDEELLKESKFIRFQEGENRITLASDGEKIRNAYGNAVVEFKTKDEQILSVKPGPILRALAEALDKNKTLVNNVLVLTRTGLGKDDTRYTDIRVEAPASN